MIYAVAGDDEEGDTPWMWENEEGARNRVDYTPISRALGLRFGVTQGRRTYVRWGKQAYEVGEGWLTRPGHTLMGKSSMSVKTFLEQFASVNSAGWDMPWKTKKVIGVYEVEGKFLDSRLFAFGSKFVPMTVLAMFTDKPSTVFAPAKLGMSKTAAVDKLYPLFYAFADKEVADKFNSRSAIRKSLRASVGGILDAAERNGYDADAVFGEALSAAASRVYREGFEELNRRGGPREEEMAKVVRRLRRLGKTSKNFRSSMKTRFELQKYDKYDETRRQAVRKAFEDTQP